MPTNRPFTWQQVAQDYPEFMAWVRTQSAKNLAGPVDIDEYNSYKAAYGAYLTQQQQQLTAMEAPAPDATA